MIDRLSPLREIRHREVAQPSGVRETLQVRNHLLGMSIDHADGFENTVTALRAQLPDAERGRSGVHLRERVREVGALHVGSHGIDHECEAPGHDPSLEGRNTHRLIALQLNGRAA